MSWAVRRRLIVFTILGGVAAAFVAVILIAALYETPSCTDGKQNQDETGVDCGGACQFLCTAALEPPTVLFTAALSPVPGRADIVALVENKNETSGAQAVPYRIDLYGTDRTLLSSVPGTLDLPPGAVMPVFVPNVPIGKQTIATAFLEIDPEVPQWFTLPRDPRTVPTVSSVVRGGTIDAPRVDAALTNPSTDELRGVKVVVLVYDAGGQVVGASQTVVPSIPPQGSARATFTWNSAFSASPASVRVLPVVPL